MTSSSRLPKHSWTKEEEAGLVKCFVELVNAGGWRSDNGTFHPGYLNQLARMMVFKIPEKEVFDDWVKSHPGAKGLLNKSFVHYDELLYVFGKDRATGGRAESFVNIGSNDPAGTLRVSEHRNVSSGSKRKHPGHATDSGDIVHIAIEYGNEQLNRIVEWPILQRQDASQTRQEVVQQLEAIPELTLMDRCRLMRILMCNIDDMKAFLEVPDNMKYSFCSIILQKNR
ncbi:retrotransposon protein [Cucumis melo var. makuwa]|uniref:Retrotransposon protein n=1 Tax=Cucumis melo var. makuwa TaxID=1194695 RepID=A0A5A7U0F9_CUCMM|nr:retrotransposon protein [Cucumis melo var. makuwa]